MKNFAFIIIGFLFLNSVELFSQSNNTSTNDAIRIKQKSLVICLSGYSKGLTNKNKIDSINDIIKKVIPKNWTLSKVIDYIPNDKILEFDEANKEKYYYLNISKSKSESMKIYDKNADLSKTDYYHINASYDLRLCIYEYLWDNFSKSKYQSNICDVAIPFYRDSLNEVSLTISILMLQKQIEQLFNKDYTSILKSTDFIYKNGYKIKNKILLIPREYISPDVLENEIKEKYPYKYEICEMDKLNNAIINRDASYAVTLYVPVAVGGEVIHRLSFVNAGDGFLYGVADGNTVKMQDNRTPIAGEKAYFFGKKELKQLAKVPEVQSVGCFRGCILKMVGK